jgi:K+-sensing histidine kinase KdpD
MAFDTSTLLSAQLHDIKNEMQALLNLQGELAEQLVDQPEQAATLARIGEHSGYLNQRLIELLSVLKIQNTSFAPNESEHWLMDTLTPIFQDFKRLKGFEVTCDIDPDFNQFYDEQLLAIALQNIFGNAKQAGANSASISIQEFNDGHWLIEVADDGPGFEPEQLKKGEFNPQGTSSGLGLYLIEEAIKAHKRNGKHGNLAIGNTKNGGAKIQLIFP